MDFVNFRFVQVTCPTATEAFVATGEVGNATATNGKLIYDANTQQYAFNLQVRVHTCVHTFMQCVGMLPALAPCNSMYLRKPAPSSELAHHAPPARNNEQLTRHALQSGQLASWYSSQPHSSQPQTLTPCIGVFLGPCACR